MDHRSREHRRRETIARLVQTSGDLSTTSFARLPRMAATSLRGGVLALLVKMRRRPSTPGELESIQRIVGSLGKLKSVAMKMGQHLSYIDSSIPDEVKAAMSALQTHSPPISVLRITKILREELGVRAAPLIETMEEQPIAVASIGQVHRARLPDGTQVAVKVRIPGVAEAIKSDFGPASVAVRIASWLYPQARLTGPDNFLDEARARVLEECDYRAEAHHQIELARRFAGHRVIAIPAVHQAYSTERVLTTTFVDGVHLDEFLIGEPSQLDRDRLGTALHDFYVGSLLKWGILSGDPHPGNYLFTRDGKIAIVDHGCTRTYDITGDHLVRVARVLQAPEKSTAYRTSIELGGEALLLLRVRFGLASVLARLGTRAEWRELVQSSASLDHSLPIPIPAAVAFQVVLVDAGTRTIEMVREIRDLFGLGIREAKNLVDQTPHVVKRTANRDEAEALKRRLEVSGGVVEIQTLAADA